MNPRNIGFRKTRRSFEKPTEYLMNARLDLGQARRGNDLLPRKAILTPKIVNLCVCG